MQPRQHEYLTAVFLARPYQGDRFLLAHGALGQQQGMRLMTLEHLGDLRRPADQRQHQAIEITAVPVEKTQRTQAALRMRPELVDHISTRMFEPDHDRRMCHRSRPAQRPHQEIQQCPGQHHRDADGEREVFQAGRHTEQQGSAEQHRHCHQPAADDAGQIIQHRQRQARAVQAAVVEQHDQDQPEAELGGQIPVPCGQADQAGTHIARDEQRSHATSEQRFPGRWHPPQIALHQPQARPSGRRRCCRDRLGRAGYSAWVSYSLIYKEMLKALRPC